MTTSDSSENPDKLDSSKIIPVIEEKLTIDKRKIETGKVTIVKKVKEQEVSKELTDFQEEIQIERVAMNQPVSSPPSVRQEGDTMVIPVVREEVVIHKQLVLVEEIRVTTHRKEIKRPVKVTLRREEVFIERKTITDPES